MPTVRIWRVRSPTLAKESWGFRYGRPECWSGATLRLALCGRPRRSNHAKPSRHQVGNDSLASKWGVSFAVRFEPRASNDKAADARSVGSVTPAEFVSGFFEIGQASNPVPGSIVPAKLFRQRLVEHVEAHLSGKVASATKGSRGGSGSRPDLVMALGVLSAPPCIGPPASCSPLSGKSSSNTTREFRRRIRRGFRNHRDRCPCRGTSAGLRGCYRLASSRDWRATIPVACGIRAIERVGRIARRLKCSSA